MFSSYALFLIASFLNHDALTFIRLWRLEEDRTSDNGGDLAMTDGSFQRYRRLKVDGDFGDLNDLGNLGSFG
ncbi:hypothetical protein Q3G72_031087 [Acer saccharum]|nr:hypothetical protein Q3G72_031087 [Acer saccharum]